MNITNQLLEIVWISYDSLNGADVNSGSGSGAGVGQDYGHVNANFAISGILKSSAPFKTNTGNWFCLINKKYPLIIILLFFWGINLNLTSLNRC